MLAFLAVIFIGCLAVGVLAVSAEEQKTSSFAMETGASARATEPAGLRFKVKLGQEEYESLVVQGENGVEYAAGKSLKVIIVPASYLTEEIVAEGNYKDAFTKKSEVTVDAATIYADGEYYYANAVLTNILYQNLNREFVAIAYIEDGETVRYTAVSAEDGRSIVYIASAALVKEESTLTEAKKTALDKFVQLAIAQKKGIEQATAEENFASGTREQVTAEFAENEISLEIGESAKLNVTVSPDVSLYKEWSSENDGVATVAEDGTVTAVSAGSAVVRVNVYGAEASLTVNVKAPIAAQENFDEAIMSGSSVVGNFQKIDSSNYATLSLTSNTDEIPENGGGQALKVAFAGKDYYYPGVNMVPADKLVVGAQYTFSVDVKAVTDVGFIYMKLEGKNDGANNANSGSLLAGQSKTITLELTITKEQPEILVFIVSQNGRDEQFTVDNVTIREKEQIAITDRPESDTVLLQDGAFKLGYALLGGAQVDAVTWTSSATDVAEIAQDGTVTPKAAGKTNITVSTAVYSFSFELNVKEATLLASEDFDGEFEVTQGDNWLGTGAQVTFRGAGYDMKHSEDPNHVLGEENGKCLFWQPWDGSWASLYFNNLPLETGNVYRLQFSAKLVSHNADISGNFNVFIRYKDAQDTTKDIIVPVNFTAVGDTVQFSYVLDLTGIEFSEMQVWLSAMTTSGTQISLDNFALYQL